jgi:hypothetical protein
LKAIKIIHIGKILAKRRLVRIYGRIVTVDFSILPSSWNNNIDCSIAADRRLLITQNSKSRPYPVSATMMAPLLKWIFLDIFVRLSTLAFNVCNVYADWDLYAH